MDRAGSRLRHPRTAVHGNHDLRFSDAGTFRYHCSMHPFMTGSVSVPARAVGSASSGWRITWSVRTSTPANRRFDVRVKRVGASTWTSYRKATAKRSGSFDPARAGSYLGRGSQPQRGRRGLRVVARADRRGVLIATLER